VTTSACFDFIGVDVVHMLEVVPSYEKHNVAAKHNLASNAAIFMLGPLVESLDN